MDLCPHELVVIKVIVVVGGEVAVLGTVFPAGLVVGTAMGADACAYTDFAAAIVAGKGVFWMVLGHRVKVNNLGERRCSSGEFKIPLNRRTYA